MVKTKRQRAKQLLSWRTNNPTNELYRRVLLALSDLDLPHSKGLSVRELENIVALSPAMVYQCATGRRMIPREAYPAIARASRDILQKAIKLPIMSLHSE
jgi:hypothetical protein